VPSEVGSGQIAFFATFKGVRKAVDAETGGAIKSARGLFDRGFRDAGTSAGKGFGESFKSSTRDITSTTLKQATADVAKASRELAAVRLKEQDAAGKVRVAESQLAEARIRYAANSSQVVRAEERLTSVQRAHISTMSGVVSGTDRLTAAQRALASASDAAASSGARVDGTFARLPGTFRTAGSQSAASFGSSFKTNVAQIFTGAALAGVVTQGAFSFGRSIGDAVSAGLGYGLQGVNLASDLQQTTGAIQAVFKDQAGIIETFGRSAATDVGLARSAYLGFSKVVGAQLKNLGVPMDQVAGKTNDLIVLGADLAAMYGGPTSDAVSALSSLLRGERDPIERYAVGLKQVDIDARKAAMGLGELEGEADKQATIQATLALLWEQTADAQGTFFREQDTYAHKQQVLNAQLDEAQTRLGEALLPAFSAGASFANDTLIPALDGVIDRIGPQLSTALETAGPGFEILAEKAIPLLEGLITAGAEDGIPALIGGLTDFAEAAPEWAEAFKTVDDGVRGADAGFRTFQEGLINGRQDRIDAFDDWLNSTGGMLSDFNTNTKGMFNDFFATTGEGWNSWLDKLVRDTDLTIPGIQDAGGRFAKGFADGITLNKGYATAAGKELANEAIRSTKWSLEIASPSKVGLGIGENFTESVASGMARRLASVDSAARMLAAVPAGVSLSAPGTGAGSTSALPPIYVQNPFTGEYLLAELDGRAADVVNRYDADQRARLSQGTRSIG
jgi:hypothetical protein